MGGGVIISASPAIIGSKQYYVAKGSAPWYNDTWRDDSHVVSTDESVSGQATVVCDGNVTDMSYMFYKCFNLTSLDLSGFDTSKVTSMNFMFNNCSNLTALDVSNFNTSKVTSMNYMFNNCRNLASVDLSSFDTTNIDDMESMFGYCSNLTALDVSNFNTSKATDMNYMFSNCSNLTELDLFDTSNVVNMHSMFSNCSNLTTIKGIINMKSCEDCTAMFRKCTSLKGVKIKNPPSGFERMTGLSSSQYTIVS